MEFDIDEAFIRREKAEARTLRKSRWWQSLINKAKCYYCQTPLTREAVTMDHIVPISRGGRSTKGNIVPACKKCNALKKDMTVVEWEDYRRETLKSR
jgi:5-methylcytosine-specific restriction endonuclease McrA